MPIPDLVRTSDPLLDTDADVLIVLVPRIEADADAAPGLPGLSRALRAVGFSGAAGSSAKVFLPELSEHPFLAVGLGAEPAVSSVRDAAGAAMRAATGFASAALSIAAEVDASVWAAAAEGAALGGYRFDDYKTSTSAVRPTTVALHTELLDGSAIARATAVGEAVALTKDLVHIPAEWLSPADFADRAADEVAPFGVHVRVLDGADLAAEGFGGILGVGQGSDRPPRLVQLDYVPEHDGAPHVSLVGKGITFDTGGLSLKPPAGMVGMKYDMAGAATALAVVRAAAALRLPVRVSAWLCIADNMPSGHATRPGDVLTMRDGTTVEVLNTDAEGRLVMADGLVAASATAPDVIIDVATLTGAIIVALGHRHIGVMGEDAAVAEYLAAAEAAAEPAWHLPLPEYMESDLESPIADLVNAKIGDPSGGSLFAGLFLRRFVGRVSEAADAPRIPWVHLDIAGAGTHKGAPYGFTDKGPTAAAVRSLIAFVEGRAR